jgi:hypothetical protein
MVRSLYRPTREQPALHPAAQAVIDDMAAAQEPPLHTSDYDPLSLNPGDHFDHDPLASNAKSYDALAWKSGPATDNWGRRLNRR